MTHKYALPEPRGVDTAPEDGTVMEVASVWINNTLPVIMVRPAYDDPKDMGHLLAELCWNFAHAYEKRGGMTQAQALEALKVGWIQGHKSGDETLKKASQ